MNASEALDKLSVLDNVPANMARGAIHYFADGTYSADQLRVRADKLEELLTVRRISGAAGDVYRDCIALMREVAGPAAQPASTVEAIESNLDLVLKIVASGRFGLHWDVEPLVHKIRQQVRGLDSRPVGVGDKEMLT